MGGGDVAGGDGVRRVGQRGKQGNAGRACAPTAVVLAVVVRVLLASCVVQAYGPRAQHSARRYPKRRALQLSTAARDNTLSDGILKGRSCVDPFDRVPWSGSTCRQIVKPLQLDRCNTTGHALPPLPCPSLPTCSSIQSNSLLMYSGADSRTGFFTLTPSAHRYSYCAAGGGSARRNAHAWNCTLTEQLPRVGPHTARCSTKPSLRSTTPALPPKTLLSHLPSSAAALAATSTCIPAPRPCRNLPSAPLNAALAPTARPRPRTFVPALMTSHVRSVQNSSSVAYSTEMAL